MRPLWLEWIMEVSLPNSFSRYSSFWPTPAKQPTSAYTNKTSRYIELLDGNQLQPHTYDMQKQKDITGALAPKPPNRKTVNIHHSPSQNLPFFEIKKLTTSTDLWPNPSHPTPSYSLAATQAPSDHTIHQFQDKLSHRSSVVKFQLEVGLHKSPWQLGVSMGSGDGCGRGFKNVPWMYTYIYIYQLGDDSWYLPL